MTSRVSLPLSNLSLGAARVLRRVVEKARQGCAKWHKGVTVVSPETLVFPAWSLLSLPSLPIFKVVVNIRSGAIKLFLSSKVVTGRDAPTVAKSARTFHVLLKKDSP